MPVLSSSLLGTFQLLTDGGQSIDATTAGSASGVLQSIRFAIGTASANSVTQLPAGAVVQDCFVDVTTPYSGGATIAVGVAANPSAFMATSRNTPTIAGVYSVSPQDVPVSPPSTVLATVGGAPAVGAAVVTVRYSIPQP